MSVAGEHQTFGRKVIYTSLVPDIETVPKIITDAMVAHMMNVSDIRYLTNYFLGKQPVLEKQKNVRPDINNQVCLNYAWSTVRDTTGYFMGTPLQYTALTADKASAVQELNSAMDLECRSTIDKEVEDFCAICGVGYKCTLVDPIGEENEVPFTLMSLSPFNTFVVYSTAMGHAPVLSVNFFDYKDENDMPCRRYIAYTNDTAYEYLTAGELNYVGAKDLISTNPHMHGSNPIVEYKNNQWRMGDFEMVTTLFDAINLTTSNSLDDVEQVVEALLLLFGIPEDEHENIQTLENGDVLVFSGEQGINQDGKYLQCSLDSQTISQLREYLEEAYKVVVGIPDRKTRGGGGGDTGDAVKLRDGWADLELVARAKELFWKQSEKRSLKVAIKLMQDKGQLKGLSLLDVDMMFSRNKNDNLQTKTTAGSMLYNMKVDKSDIAQAMNITTDIVGFVDRWKANEEAAQVRQVELFCQQKQVEGGTQADGDDGDDKKQGNRPKADEKDDKKDVKDDNGDE